MRRVPVTFSAALPLQIPHQRRTQPPRCQRDETNHEAVQDLRKRKANREGGALEPRQRSPPCPLGPYGSQSSARNVTQPGQHCSPKTRSAGSKSRQPPREATTTVHSPRQASSCHGAHHSKGHIRGHTTALGRHRAREERARRRGWESDISGGHGGYFGPWSGSSG